MKNVRVFILVAAMMLLSVAQTLLAAPPASGLLSRYSYDPAYVYPGQYSTSSLYYHNPGNPTWRIGFRKDLSAVTCREAFNSFTRTGTWRGHLRQDGSCADPAEGVEWAVGNKLNFDAARKP